MPSIFESTVETLVKELGDKELRPVKGIMDANRIHRFSLIQKRKDKSLFWKLPEVPLNISLMDILEPGVLPDAPVEKLGDLDMKTTWKLDMGASVNAEAEASLSGETTKHQKFSLHYKTVSTPFKTWRDLQKRKVMDPEPLFLKKCRKNGTKLYVVSDVVELQECSVLRDLSSTDVSGKLFLSLKSFLKFEGRGGAVSATETQHTVQKGSVMAYRREQLVFQKNGWEILPGSGDEEETFPEACYGSSIPELKDATFRDAWDFPRLQEEVYRREMAAAQLSKAIKDTVFSNLLAMLGDREALQDLMDTLEQEPVGDLDGPGGSILNELRQDSSYAWNGSQDVILYLLEAMMVLSDIQHRLLAQSMEKQILSQQRDLVRSILEPNFKYPWSIPFTLKPALLAPLQAEGVAITYGLLDECGLKMELNSPRSAWDLGAKKPLCALYGALSVLQQLAQA
ncbi:LOW QUALITY PROTEIN: gasdermin-C-like [Pteronotus mesoamericanus]|uniref:LOW QUALITY PROTEIN: gasdermin-C-like n=1 Tax=Pteronotus mesoamericanus TaxID=1884717 RepID=UPI0023EB72E5|nr:LOW QUALITY PROTEIN: gasdermin-C-like [Pteronotus parnellii mesoamericanus]